MSEVYHPPIRLGCVGVDSSHLPEFSRRINGGWSRCRVTHYFDDGRHDWKNPADVATWVAAAESLGVTRAASMDELLDSVDGVLVLAVNGHRHLDLATPALKRGLPTYIDKPLTCSLAEARRLLAMSRESNARCYSASSLRFVTELETIDFAALGALVAIDAYGAGELLPMMPHLWHYGCHGVEMVDAIFAASGQGAGVARVRAVATEPRHLVEYDYADGRHVNLRLERAGTWGFGATLHGTKSVRQFTVDFAPVYTRLVEGMTRFFEGATPPVALRDIVETIAVLEAGNDSIEGGGSWHDVEDVR